MAVVFSCYLCERDRTKVNNRRNERNITLAKGKKERKRKKEHVII